MVAGALDHDARYALDFRGHAVVFSIDAPAADRLGLDVDVPGIVRAVTVDAIGLSWAPYGDNELVWVPLAEVEDIELDEG